MYLSAFKSTFPSSGLVLMSGSFVHLSGSNNLIDIVFVFGGIGGFARSSLNSPPSGNEMPNNCQGLLKLTLENLRQKLVGSFPEFNMAFKASFFWNLIRIFGVDFVQGMRNRFTRDTTHPSAGDTTHPSAATEDSETECVSNVLYILIQTRSTKTHFLPWIQK